MKAANQRHRQSLLHDTNNNLNTEIIEIKIKNFEGEGSLQKYKRAVSIKDVVKIDIADTNNITKECVLMSYLVR